MDWRPVLDQLLRHAERLQPWVRDVSLLLARGDARRASRSCSKARRARCSTSITAPIRTSRRRTPRSAASAPGLGVGPRAIGGVLGVVKAYTTRVGEGPLPTELSGEMGNRLRESGNEYGAVTGRPRRCGWFDAVVARYGARINGLDALALTKLDVLDGLERIEICTAYTLRRPHAHRISVGHRRSSPPASRSTNRCPAGRRRPPASARFDDLPENARRYIARLEEVSGVPAAIVSTGSERDDTILRHDVLQKANLKLRV